MTLGAAVDLIVAKAILVPSSSAPEPVLEAAVRARFELLLIMMRKRDRVIGFRQSVYPDHGSVAGQVVSSYSQPCPTGPSCSVVFKALVLKANPYYPRWSIGSSSDRSDFGCSKRHKCRWLRHLQWTFRTSVKHRVVCAVAGSRAGRFLTPMYVGYTLTKLLASNAKILDVKNRYPTIPDLLSLRYLFISSFPKRAICIYWFTKMNSFCQCAPSLRLLKWMGSCIQGPTSCNEQDGVQSLFHHRFFSDRETAAEHRINPDRAD